MARHTLYYQKALSELEPQYDECPEPCADTGRELSAECRACPVRAAYEGFEEDSAEELKERCGDDSQAWSFKSLARDVRAALATDYRLKGKGYPRRCSAIEAALLNILRDEKVKLRRCADHARKQEIEARKRQG